MTAVHLTPPPGRRLVDLLLDAADEARRGGKREFRFMRTRYRVMQVAGRLLVTTGNGTTLVAERSAIQ